MVNFLMSMGLKDLFFIFVSQQELVVALSHHVVQYETNFCTVALQFMEEEKNYALPSPAAPGTLIIFFVGTKF